jgi:hypothetical protein
LKVLTKVPIYVSYLTVITTNTYKHMEIRNLSAAALRRAAAIKEKMDSLENEFLKLLEEGGISGRSQGLKVLGKVGRKRRTMTAAARKALSAKLKAAWARRKAAKKG